MKNIAIYVRAGTTIKGIPLIIEQLKACNDYAVTHGLIVNKVYVDIAESANNYSRNGYSQLMNDIDKENINSVIISDVSRVSRDGNIMQIICEMNKKGVDFILVEGGTKYIKGSLINEMKMKINKFI